MNAKLKNNKNEKMLIFQYFLVLILEAPPGFEPGIRVLQTRALPLGYSAEYFKVELMNKFAYLRLATALRILTL